jgi:hypothetical protein
LAGARPFDEKENRGIKIRFSVAGVFYLFSRVYQKCKKLIQCQKFKRAFYHPKRVFRPGCPGKGEVLLSIEIERIK